MASPVYYFYNVLTLARFPRSSSVNALTRLTPSACVFDMPSCRAFCIVVLVYKSRVELWAMSAKLRVPALNIFLVRSVTVIIPAFSFDGKFENIESDGSVTIIDFYSL